MMIILGILYGKDVRTPKDIHFPILEKVTVLVDKFQWHALVAPHATSWYESLAGNRTMAYHPVLLTWIWIAFVFSIQHRFKMFSQIVIREMSKSLDPKDEKIRLPTPVISKWLHFLVTPSATNGLDIKLVYAARC